MTPEYCSCKSNAGLTETESPACRLSRSCPTGAAVLVSAPMGKGFNVSAIPPAQFPTVLIFATGSGGCLGQLAA